MSAILFLDVDGVLNHRAVFCQGEPSPLCAVAVARLKATIARTGAKVVLSSTWRRGDRAKDWHLQKLEQVGVLALAHDDWRTRYDLGGEATDGGIILPVPRGAEIAEWLSRHPEVNTFAIIDDDCDMLPEQADKFVQTAFDTGLLDEHCIALERILSALPAPKTAGGAA